MAAPSLGRMIQYADLARQARKVKKASDEIVRTNARRHLVQRMGRLRGLPQKIGQILSMSPDEGVQDAFSELTDHAQPMPFDEIEPVLVEAWGVPVEAVVANIDSVGQAASLGQVHRATLHDGREVAIKVQYPGIREATMADLKMLGWLSKPVGDLRRGFDLADYRAEILRDLEEELDYCVEAKHQQRYAALVADTPEWIVPQVITERSNDRVLTMTWHEGERIDEVAKWPKEARTATGDLLVRHFCRALFGHRMIHADPHPGNYRFRLVGGRFVQIILYDYGCVVEISEDRRLALLKLIEMANCEQGDPYPLMLAVGFNETLLEPIRKKLAALCRVLFEPFGSPARYDLEGWNRGERIADILGDDKWNFRMSGPADLIFVLRAFHGLVFYLEQLEASVSWQRAVAPVIEEAQPALSKIDTSVTTCTSGTFEGLANHLKLRVSENGAQKVALTFPARCVDHLDELIDDDLAKRIRERQIDLQAVVHRVRASAYAPQELFTLDDSRTSKSVRVWLE